MEKIPLQLDRYNKLFRYTTYFSTIEPQQRPSEKVLKKSLEILNSEYAVFQYSHKEIVSRCSSHRRQKKVRIFQRRFGSKIWRSVPYYLCWNWKFNKRTNAKFAVRNFTTNRFFTIFTTFPGFLAKLPWRKITTFIITQFFGKFYGMASISWPVYYKC